ncbi:gastrula zinc finger protein XlCGF53.1-like [Wyeomyia smithii]|uniref:gastrula zinc finger protein XlCGF53.1-like n=1 Tax=Wyeomyia smithii TaxID=174621 RepID=UPI002467AECC|nr:gastrula zinc finger protein XlCGF53.1-like [Wyeomyia smithii]
MVCAVPSCAGLEKRLIPFPENLILKKHWTQAIQVGTGLDPSAHHREAICSWHFGNQGLTTGYWEPSKFLHKTGKVIQVACCRFCLKFDNRARMLSRDKILAKPYLSRAIEDVLNIHLSTNDFLSEVCVDCQKNIDILDKWIQSSKTTETEYRRLEVAAECSIFNIKDNFRNNEGGFTAETLEIEIGDIKVECPEDPLESQYRNIEEPTCDIVPSLKKETELCLRKKIAPVIKFNHPPNVPTKRGPKHKRVSAENKMKIKFKDILSRKCYICNSLLEDREELVAHLTERHAIGENHKCPECDKSFKFVTAMNRHLSLHDKSNRPLECSYCSVGFKVKYSLQVHENREHNAGHNIRQKKKITEKKFQCSSCGQTFRTNYDLLDHDRFYHQNIPGATCKLCNKHFRHRSSLRKHQIVHIGDKPYECTHCGSAFKSTITLVNHIAKEHGIKT